MNFLRKNPTIYVCHGAQVVELDPFKVTSILLITSSYASVLVPTNISR